MRKTMKLSGAYLITDEYEAVLSSALWGCTLLRSACLLDISHLFGSMMTR